MSCPEVSDEIRRSACSISNFNIADVACRSSFICCCLIIFESKIYDFRDGVGLSALHVSSWSRTSLTQARPVGWGRGCQVCWYAAGQEHPRTLKQHRSNDLFVHFLTCFNKTGYCHVTCQVTWQKSSQVAGQEKQVKVKSSLFLMLIK